MSSKIKRVGAILLIAPLVQAGCTRCGAKVWVEDTRELSFPAATIEKLSIKTHNGAVTITGDENHDDVHVVVACKGGGSTKESARACLAAIELVSEASGDGTHRLGWQWGTLKQADWAARVAFDISLPARLDVGAETHNGGVVVRGVGGACALKTHNGGVKIRAGDGPVTAQTHNGGIDATCGAETIELITHNGGVRLNAAACEKLGGRIVTHNGGVVLELGEKTATELSCRTYNGRITCDVPWKVTTLSRRRAEGTVGVGGPAFSAQTYNGAVKIVRAPTP